MDAKRKRWLIALGAGLLLLAVGLSLAWRYTPLREVITIENVVGFIDDFSGKWWAPIVLALVYTPASVIMFPRPLLTMAAAAVFGPLKGFAIAMAGVLVSAIVFYFIGQRIKERTMRRLAGPRMDRLTRLLRKEGFMAIAAIGFVPVAPFSIEMIVAGALRVRLRDLLLGVAVAHLPGTIATTLLGDQVAAAFRGGREVNRLVIVLSVAVFLGMAYFARRMWQRLEAQA
jgi:phospholipase D1/2